MFVVQIPLSFIFGWNESITYVTLLSQWALVEGAAASYAASRAEKKINDRAGTDQTKDSS
jgi:hypothetical protein